jgi:hypothetical protein
MGIGIAAWRQRIGSFSQFASCYRGLSGFARHATVTPRLACIIALLLIVGGVELNPGPGQPKQQLDEIVHRIDQLFNELRETRATLATKIEDSARDLSARLRSCEDLMTSYCTRLSNVERTHDAMTGQITALQASVAALNNPAPAAAAAAAPSLLQINDVLHELDLRVTKKANIVISGILPPAPPLTDSAIVMKLLREGLGINATVISCARLGKPSADVNRPCRLLATLSSDADSLAAMRSATKLRNSTDPHVRQHVFINADMTPEQRKQDYNLRMELKRRRAAGEPNLVILNGKLHTKAPRPSCWCSPPGCWRHCLTACSITSSLS